MEKPAARIPGFRINHISQHLVGEGGDAGNTRPVHLPPYSVVRECIQWIPPFSGHVCLQVTLEIEGYEPQDSQRNVDVVDRPACGITGIYTFTIANDTPLPVTVDLGMVTFSVPADWVITLDPGGSVDIGPYGELVVKVHVTIPCLTTSQSWLDSRTINAIQAESKAIPIIDVERYIDGKLIGGIELQFEPEVEYLYFLPLIQKH